MAWLKGRWVGGRKPNGISQVTFASPVLQLPRLHVRREEGEITLPSQVSIPLALLGTGDCCAGRLDFTRAD